MHKKVKYKNRTNIPLLIPRVDIST